MNTNIKNWIIVALVGILLPTTSCTDDVATLDNTNNSMTTLHLKVSGSKAPASYAIGGNNENYISELDILIFNKNGASEEYAYTRQLSASDIKNTIANGNEKSLAVNLTPTPAGQEIRVVIIANARSFIPAIAVGTPKQVALSNITASMSGNTWNVNSNSDFDPFPMWGESQLHELNPNVDIPPITLIRSLAKVDIGLNFVRNIPQGLDNFKLKKVHLYNINKDGKVVPADGNFSEADTCAIAPSISVGVVSIAGPVEYLAVSDKEILNSIYLFETERGSTPATRTFAVLEGEYEGTNTFYRVDFIKKEAGVTTFVDILRNFRYRLNIINVQRSGLSTLNDAVNSIGINESIEVEVDIVSESVTTDGSNYLSMSQAVFELYEPNAIINNQVILQTNAANGWTATALDPWITITSTNQGAQGVSSTLTFDVAPSGGALRDGSILIRAGEIHQYIKVKQSYAAILPAGYAGFNNSQLEVYVKDIDVESYPLWDILNIERDLMLNAPTEYYKIGVKTTDPRKPNCYNLEAGGYNDWRLPDIEELEAIMQYALDNDGTQMINYKRQIMEGYLSHQFEKTTTSELPIYLSTSKSFKYSKIKSLQSKFTAEAYNFDAAWVLKNDRSRLAAYLSFKDQKPSITEIMINTLSGFNQYTVMNQEFYETESSNKHTYLWHNKVFMKCVRGDYPPHELIVPQSETRLGYDLQLAPYDLYFNDRMGMTYQDRSWYAAMNKQENDWENNMPTPDPSRRLSCAMLNEGTGTSGYSDWRVPTENEMMAIFEYLNTGDKMQSFEFQIDAESPLLTGLYRTSEDLYQDTVCIQYYFDDLLAHTVDKYGDAILRCVRNYN